MEIMTYDEFEKELKSQGVEINKVTFECPKCKTLQCGDDLIEAGAGKDLDEIEKYLAFSCVGRWDKDKGCDWTLGGLFQIHKLEIITPDGKHHPRFKPVRHNKKEQKNE